MSKFFELKRIVELIDIDELNHVNNTVYVKWMDDIARKHWIFLTKEKNVLAYVWVVLKHEIEYINQAFINDEIIIKTWVGETKGFKSERYFEFYKNKQLLVKSITTYGMLDSKTFKPTRIRENVLKLLEPFK